MNNSLGVAFSSIQLWMTSFILLGGSVLLGFIVEGFVLRRLHRLAEKTRWEGDDILIAALRRRTTLWIILVGIFGALQTSPLPAEYIDLGNKILLIIAILSATAALVKIASGLVEAFAKSTGGAFPSTSIFSTITKVTVFSIGILIILQSLGISITPILTALGIAGLAVALALQEPLSNLFAGLNIIVSREVRPGDYIKLDSGEEGYVVDITWRNTSIRELPNNRIIIPNAKLASAIVKNYYLPEKEMAVLVQVGVDYTSDLPKVERVTMEVGREVMKAVQGGVPSFEPFIRYHTFNDFSIDFTVILRAQEFVDQYLIKHEFVKRLHARYNKEGITIPFPIRTIQMEGGEKIPVA